MQNFVRFHAIESEIELSQEFWEKRNSSAPTAQYVPECIIVTSNDVYFVN